MKRRIAITILMFLLAIGVSQAAKRDTTTAEGYKIHVVTDREDALYHVGDEVTFTITLKKDDAPVTEGKVAVDLSNDLADRIGERQNLSLTGKPLTVKGTFDKPGFLRCRASFALPSGKEIFAMAGAGFDPEKIQPSGPPPADFDAFWADQLAQLAKVPMNAKLVPVDSGKPNIEAFEVTLDCLGGAPVRGYYARPKGAKPGTLPVVITPHSAGVKTASKSGPVGRAAHGDGMIAMDFNAHGIENGKPKQYYTDLAKGDLKDYTQRGKESRDDIYFRGMYLRLYRAMEFMMAQPEWDGKNFGVCGSSQGGGQALVAAGLNPKVNCFVASVPALCEHGGYVNGWPRFVRPERGPVDPKVVEAAQYVDAMHFATRTKARAIVAVGFIDSTCRPTTVYAAYNNLKGPKTMMTFPLMGHEWRREIFDAFTVAFDEEIAKSRGK